MLIEKDSSETAKLTSTTHHGGLDLYCTVANKSYKLGVEDLKSSRTPQVLYIDRSLSMSRVHCNHQNEEKGELIHGAPSLKFMSASK